MDVRVFSFGGGVQSTAVMVLQAAGKLQQLYDFFVFPNVGADSESPLTLAYINEVVRPFALKNGLTFVETSLERARGTLSGKQETLLEYVKRRGASVPIPVRMSNGASGNRTCVNEFKVRVIDRWIRDKGYASAVIGLGISVDEVSRMRDTFERFENGLLKRREYPLIDLRLRRADCQKLVVGAGLPLAPKSSCWFCPFHNRAYWVQLRASQPELFQRAVQLEEEINRARAAAGRDSVFLHSSCKPLADAVADQRPLLWSDDDFCEAGYCLT